MQLVRKQIPIYTKKGDRGETGLPGGRRLTKADRLFEVLGGLDQTSATIGLAVSHITGAKSLVDQLQEIQRTFLAIGATLAAEQPQNMPILKVLPKMTKELEATIDKWDKELPELKNFILAGGSTAGATLHQARTFIRQTERNYHRLDDSQKIEVISVYINRLSDYLFQAARYYNFLQKQPESIWKY